MEAGPARGSITITPYDGDVGEAKEIDVIFAAGIV